MEVTFIFLVTIFVVSLHRFFQGYQRRKRIWDAIEPFGGEKWYPLVGTCLDLIKASRDNFYEVYSARNKKHGPLFRTWMGSIPAIHVMKPDHIERILNNTVNLTKGDIYKFVEPWLGEGLITGSDHKKWHRHRKLLTPTFHFSVLDNMMEVMTEKGQYLADRLTQKADGKFFNIYPYLTLCELDIICVIAYYIRSRDAHLFTSWAAYPEAIETMLEIICGSNKPSGDSAQFNIRIRKLVCRNQQYASTRAASGASCTQRYVKYQSYFIAETDIKPW
ncbi:hypothetical protein MTP99_000506 [Tenebrio molitor]|nr:hypothetical protein MTP99_000506 [Tenebrio molitor]